MSNTPGTVPPQRKQYTEEEKRRLMEELRGQVRRVSKPEPVPEPSEEEKLRAQIRQVEAEIRQLEDEEQELLEEELRLQVKRQEKECLELEAILREQAQRSAIKRTAARKRVRTRTLRRIFSVRRIVLFLSLVLLAAGAYYGWSYYQTKKEARLALERQEQERLEKERLERERLEQERLEQERLERERIIKLAEDGKALYDKGQYAEAVKLLSEAAEKGNALAQTYLGLCYDWGRGVEEDLAKAAELYRKAAEQGYAVAQRNLGNFYANGRGVEKDQAKADEWYAKAIAQWKKAADAGDAEGQINSASAIIMVRA